MIKDLFIQTHKLYLENLNALISNLFLYVFVFALASGIWNHYASVADPGLLMIITCAIAETVLTAVIALIALNTFLKREPFENINCRTLFIYIFTGLYIGLAFLLGALLFIIPGLLVFSSSLFYEIYILKNGNNPLQAIENSIELTKGNLARLTVAFSIFYALVFIPVILIGLIDLWLENDIATFIIDIVTNLTLVLYFPAFVVTSYNYLTQSR